MNIKFKLKKLIRKEKNLIVALINDNKIKKLLLKLYQKFNISYSEKYW